MSKGMNMSQFAFGIDYQKTKSLVRPETVWSIDRFNARKGNKLTEARLRVPYESHSTSDSKALLDIINHDKLLAGEIICDAVEGSWIGYANAMGLEYHEYGSTESRQILTLRDLRLALKQLSLRERLAAVYFVTGYARDVLHAQVMWGATHQAAVEDYVMDILNASFSTARTEMKAGHKTCVGQLYSQIFNKKKQKLQQSVLPATTLLAVESRGFTTKKNWRRQKSQYFVHTSQTNLDEGSRVDSELMDVQEANGYRKWKVGVELKLGHFQLVQSSKGCKVPFQRTDTNTPRKECQDNGGTKPGAKEIDQLSLETTLGGIVKTENETPRSQQSGRKTETIMTQRQVVKPTQETMKSAGGIVNQESKHSRYQKSELKTATMPQRTNNRAAHMTEDRHEIVPSPSTMAEEFMQSRPGGQLEARDREMKVVERRVSSKMQKKGTTSAEGRNALDKITTIMADKNKDNEATDPCVKKRQKKGERAVLITPNKRKQKDIQTATSKHKRVGSDPALKKKTKTPKEECIYGCIHGGLLELVQMIPKWTKYHLGNGNYFHDKQCKDCNGSIHDLFDKSKGKGIFYYCHMDNQVADFSDDEQEMETTACGCILCISCYYKRDEKKKLASGKSTRSSGRRRG